MLSYFVADCKTGGPMVPRIGPLNWYFWAITPIMSPDWDLPEQTTRIVHAFTLMYSLTKLLLQPSSIPGKLSKAPPLLDLLLTSHPDQYSVLVLAPLRSYDHCMVSTTLGLVAHSPPRPLVVKRCLWHHFSADEGWNAGLFCIHLVNSTLLQR